MDDTIISIISSLHQAKIIKGIFEDYERAIGQKVNFGNSKLIFFNTLLALLFGVARIFGCGIKVFLAKYLGMPLFKGRMKEEYQNLMMDRLAKKMVAWKGNL